MTIFEVEIAGTFIRRVTVEAENEEGARDRAYYDWTDWHRLVHADYSFDGDDFYAYTPKEKWGVKEKEKADG